MQDVSTCCFRHVIKQPILSLISVESFCMWLLNSQKRQETICCFWVFRYKDYREHTGFLSATWKCSYSPGNSYVALLLFNYLYFCSSRVSLISCDIRSQNKSIHWPQLQKQSRPVLASRGSTGLHSLVSLLLFLIPSHLIWVSSFGRQQTDR